MKTLTLITFCLLAFVFTAQAQAPQAVYGGILGRSPGQEFAFDVGTEGGPGFTAFQFRAHYDPTLLEVTGCTTAGTMVGESFSVYCFVPSPGTVHVAGNGPPLTGYCCSFVSIKFKALAPGWATIQFTDGLINSGPSVWYPGLVWVE